MTRLSRVTHRWVLGVAAAIGVVALLSGSLALGTENTAGTAECSSTDRFWYRLSPPGIYIDSQRGNKAFARSEGTGEKRG